MSGGKGDYVWCRELLCVSMALLCVFVVEV